MSEKIEAAEILALTADVVSSHVSNNSVALADLPQLLKDVYTTLDELAKSPIVADLVKLQPAVPIKKSITPDFLICLEDGKKLKMLKRHLKTNYNMTPEEYREKWSLSSDYPMVAPNYTSQRSSLAKKIGLGTKRVTK